MEFKAKTEPKTIDAETISAKMNAWPDCYYREMEPAIRRQLLDEAKRQGLTPEDNEIREFIFAKRYQLNKKGYVDSYLKPWMDFKYIYGSGNGSFSFKKNQKRIRTLFKELGEPEIRAMGERATEILSQEYEHSGLVYITLSSNDPAYRAVILGLGSVSEERLAQRITADFAVAVKVIPEQLGMTEELSLWTEAVKRSHHTAYPNAAF